MMTKIQWWKLKGKGEDGRKSGGVGSNGTDEDISVINGTGSARGGGREGF